MLPNNKFSTFTLDSSILTFVLPWCLSVAAEIMLLDEALDGVALLGVGRKVEELDILGVTLTMIKAR